MTIPILSTSSITAETGYRLSSTTEDKSKRRLSRIRGVLKDVGKPINRNYSTCNFSRLKLLLLAVTLGAIFTLLHSPAVHYTDHPLAFQSRPSFADISTKEISDLDKRYISNLNIDWDQISTVTNKLLKNNNDHHIALLNFNTTEIQQWTQLLPKPKHILLHLDFAPKNVTWETLYPEWIDEEEKFSVPTCPTLPNIQVQQKRQHIDFIAVKLPCTKSISWSRDVARLHLQLAVARLVASESHPVYILFVTDCFPVPNLFTCKDLVTREGNAWLYEPNLDRLREKVRLPVGSCELSLPLKAKDEWHSNNPKREAYATILHSADIYVCGAITVAQSIRMSGSTHDLVILVDDAITTYHKEGLESAGWKIRTIERIRNPKAEKDAYNEFNYSKFRVWQLTDYDKIIFIDADLLILRNIDSLFQMSEISATGNNATLFNSGVMVIEPSNCTFNLLMDHVNEIESYNGGDQGYLNEIFTWWHRVPKHMNFLKHFWEGDDEGMRDYKIRLFKANPPVLYVLHYLGLKPWLCFRDYDCNWNVDRYHEYASDIAHKKWWLIHDKMPKKLHRFCALSTKRKAALEWDRRQAKIGKYSDRHWKIKIRDKRLVICYDKFCFWKQMLRHWGQPTQGEMPRTFS